MTGFDRYIVRLPFASCARLCVRSHKRLKHISALRVSCILSPIRSAKETVRFNPLYSQIRPGINALLIRAWLRIVGKLSMVG